MKDILTKEEILLLITTLNGEIENVNQMLQEDENACFNEELNEEIQTSIKIRKKLIDYLKGI